MCVCRFEDWLNVLLHTWHLYGFSPLWILLWTTSSRDVLNRLLQAVHSNGFSPEWVLLCTARCWRLSQHLPHSVHLYLPAWIFIWLYRLPWDEKRFSHWVHGYTFSPVCILLCIFKFWRLLNRLWHFVHKNDLGLWSRGCSVILLPSASVFSSERLSDNIQCSSNIREIVWQIISPVLLYRHNV